MPSLTHEGIAEMLRLRPDFAAELLTDILGLPLPPYERIELSATEFADPGYQTYQADVVVSFSRDGRTTFAVVIEIQLGRDGDKEWSWPLYLSRLRARFRCPTMLLVLSISRPIATWCARPIAIGHPGFTLGPLVIGPDRIPTIVDAGEARRSPELALLSALTNTEDVKVLQAFAQALAAVDNVRNALYSDIVFAALPASTKPILEGVMTTRTYEYQSDFVRRYILLGRSEGEQRLIFAVLDARGFEVSPEARTRIALCYDADLLERWARRAATITTVDDLF